MPFDDGLPKTAEQRLERPDLEDMLSQPYESNVSDAPVARLDFDPGRVRVQSLFMAAYGSTADDVARQLVNVDFMGTRLRVHARAAAALERVALRLHALERKLSGPERRTFDQELLGIGTFNWRPVRGTERLSGHAFGIAIDLNSKLADYWRWGSVEHWRQRMPRQIVAAFESERFIWGGAWQHYDSMHFEYRPELFDPTCFPNPG